MAKKFTPLADLGYTVFKTTKGYAIGLTLAEAEAVEDLYIHETYESAQIALDMSIDVEEAA